MKCINECAGNHTENQGFRYSIHSNKEEPIQQKLFKSDKRERKWLHCTQSLVSRPADTMDIALYNKISIFPLSKLRQLLILVN